MYQINGKTWYIMLVHSDNPMLMRSDGSYTVGMCDRITQTIYISELLKGKFLRKVLIHEVCHSAMFSYSIDMSVEQEELFCDLVATYGDEIIGTVFTPLEYAPYVEYGTGLYAESGGRKDVPWAYKDEKTGKLIWTAGQHPNPFMRPALNENRERIVGLIREGLKID